MSSIFDGLFSKSINPEKAKGMHEIIKCAFYDGLMYSSSVGGFYNKNNGTTGALEKSEEYANEQIMKAIRQLTK